LIIFSTFLLGMTHSGLGWCSTHCNPRASERPLQAIDFATTAVVLSEIRTTFVQTMLRLSSFGAFSSRTVRG
jgi:hypothetical protein